MPVSDSGLNHDWRDNARTGFSLDPGFPSNRAARFQLGQVRFGSFEPKQRYRRVGGDRLIASRSGCLLQASVGPVKWGIPLQGITGSPSLIRG